MDKKLLLGVERLKSYDSEKQYYENPNLKGKIQPKIKLLEAALQNILDFYMSEDDTLWILPKI